RLAASVLLWRAWDRFASIQLTLMRSVQAACAAPFSRMRQNRRAAKDRLQADLDLQTDLKAETLIEELHSAVETLRLQQWQELLRIQQNQIQLLQDMLKCVDGQRAAR